MNAVLLRAHTNKKKKNTKRNKIYFVKKIQSHFRIGVDRFQMLCDR